jgi:hypothetical protein
MRELPQIDRVDPAVPDEAFPDEAFPDEAFPHERGYV